jgi:hypothetical protein
LGIDLNDLIASPSEMVAPAGNHFFLRVPCRQVKGKIDLATAPEHIRWYPCEDSHAVQRLWLAINGEVIV